MNTFLLAQYQKVSEATYHPFEIYHVYGANHLLNLGLPIRDLQILNTIATATTPITPSELSAYFDIANNALSNRLSFFESQKFITRHRANDDNRQILLAITSAGKEVADVYAKYIDSFIKRIRQKLSIMEVGTFFTTFKKLQLLLSNTDVDTEGAAPTKITSDLVMKINKYFSKFDQQLLDSHHLKLKISDAFILTEFYMGQQRGMNNLKKLSEFLMIPYQTLISKLAKIWDDGYLTKDEKSHYHLTPATIAFVESFAYQRVSVYYMTMSIFTDKERDLVLKIFAELKDFSLNYTTNQ